MCISAALVFYCVREHSPTGKGRCLDPGRLGRGLTVARALLPEGNRRPGGGRHGAGDRSGGLADAGLAAHPGDRRDGFVTRRVAWMRELHHQLRGRPDAIPCARGRGGGWGKALRTTALDSGKHRLLCSSNAPRETLASPLIHSPAGETWPLAALRPPSALGERLFVCETVSKCTLLTKTVDNHVRTRGVSPRKPLFMRVCKVVLKIWSLCNSWPDQRQKRMG